MAYDGFRAKDVVTLQYNTEANTSMRISRRRLAVATASMGLAIFISWALELNATEGRQTTLDATLTLLKNAQYSGILQQPIQLVNGQYDGGATVPGTDSRSVVTFVDELHAFGDLDGDDDVDAAVLLMERSGEHEGFIYLAAMALTEGGVVQLATTLLGEHVQIKRMDYVNGAIRVEMFVPNEGDSSPFPTRKVGATFRVLDGRLVEIRSEPLGSLTVADLEGTPWVLQPMINAQGESVATGPVTLALKDGRIAGMAACNQYSAGFEERGVGKIHIGEIIATQKACPDSLMAEEHRFLDLLGKVDRYGFSFGNLVLNTPENRLIFTPHSE